VLGKTIVRALKRYYLDLFNKSNNFKSFGQKLKNESFYRLVTEFTFSYFQESGKLEEARRSYDVNFDDLTFFVGMMVSTAHIKYHIKSAKWKKF
jgi:hypothetical protein